MRKKLLQRPGPIFPEPLQDFEFGERGQSIHQSWSLFARWKPRRELHCAFCAICGECGGEWLESALEDALCECDDNAVVGDREPAQGVRPADGQPALQHAVGGDLRRREDHGPEPHARRRGGRRRAAELIERDVGDRRAGPAAEEAPLLSDGENIEGRGPRSSDRGAEGSWPASNSRAPGSPRGRPTSCARPGSSSG